MHDPEGRLHGPVSTAPAMESGGHGLPPLGPVNTHSSLPSMMLLLSVSSEKKFPRYFLPEGAVTSRSRSRGDLVGDGRIVPSDDDLEGLRGVADIEGVVLASRIRGTQIQSCAVDGGTGLARATTVADDQPRNSTGVGRERKGVGEDDASEPLLAIAASPSGGARWE